MNNMIDPLMTSPHIIRIYYATALLSLVLAVVGFSYNAWRLERSEDNSNLRSAAFQLLSELSEFEQIIYASHYDQNQVEGSPRRGWVKASLIDDLGMLMGEDVALSSAELKAQWSADWPQVPTDRTSVESLVERLDAVRAAVKARLADLE